MADITMCVNNLCKSRATCYRYRARPSDRQSVFATEAKPVSKCGMYWEVEADDKLLMPMNKVLAEETGSK